MSKLDSCFPGVYYYLESYGNLVFGSYERRHWFVSEIDSSCHLISKTDFPYKVRRIIKVKNEAKYYVLTNNGLYLFTVGSDIPKKIPWATCMDGVDLRSIVELEDSTLWISSDNGIYYLNNKKQSCTHFTQNDGIGTTVFKSGNSLQLPDGRILFGHPFGLTVIDPSNFVDRYRNAKANISAIFINDERDSLLQDHVTNGRNVHEIKNIVLPYYKNTLTFLLSSLDYSGIDQAEYECRMLGVDNGWVDNERRGFARYANIQPGSYTFQFRVKGMTKLSNEINIIIKPPFYKTRWFISILLILGFLVIYYAAKISEKRKLKIERLKAEKILALEQERSRIARDMHDGIGSGLSALQLRTKVMATQADKTRNGGFQQLLDLIDSLNHQIRENIWVISHENDSLENLMSRLHQYASEYFESSEIRCIVTLPDVSKDFPIPGPHRRNLYMAFREALHNVQKHSSASHVEISIGSINDTLEISISDNGAGIKDSVLKDSSGNGLKSMKKRMEDVGGEFHLKTSASGTHIRLTYPLS